MRRTLRIGALVFLVAAIGFYLWYGLTNPFGVPESLLWAGPHMAVPIAALFIVPFVFAFSGASVAMALTGRNSAEFRAAPVGVGTVTSVQRTGLMVNHQPELRLGLSVQTAQGHVFHSQAKMVVPLTDLASVRQGSVLPVRYLPGRTDRVEIDRSGDTAQAQAVMHQAMVSQGLADADGLDIARRGTAAQAVVRSLEPTGEIRNGHTGLVMGLLVTRPDGSVFEVEVRKFMPPHAVERVQVGQVVGVHYLPEEEKRIVLSLPAAT